ncbi:MAG: Ribosomal large subunit methyltransferase [Actinomycetota bacterium]
MNSSTGFDFSGLRRWPDIEAPELVAVDAADRLMVQHMTEAIESGIVSDDVLAESVVVLGDNYGALTLGTLALFAEGQPMHIRVHQDSRAGEIALAANLDDVRHQIPENHTYTNLTLGPEFVRGARLVLMRLPRSLAQLDEWCALVAAHASEDVVVIAGGRIKHMTVTMNDVIDRYFGERHISHAVQKSRVIRSSRPRSVEGVRGLEAWPQSTAHPELGLTVCASGGVFAGSSIDIGTRVLLGELHRTPDAPRVIDLGCGSGILAARYASLHPDSTVIASDNSAAACVSATATVTANGLLGRVTVVQDDGLQSQPEGSADLILFNPPFHTGAAVHEETSYRLFADAAHALVDGGELWVVANSHLMYRPVLERIVGPTRQAAKTPKFTVFVSTRRRREY